MKRIHIVGSARSGTSLMLSLMANCYKNDGACSHEMSIFDEPEGTPGLFISKLPADIKRVGIVLDRAPELYVIYMERDPRAVITSKHRIDPDKYFCDFSVWKRSFNNARKLSANPRFITIRYEDLTSQPDQTQETLQTAFPFLEAVCKFSEYHEVAKPSFKAEEAMNGLRPISTDRVERWKEHLPRLAAQIKKYPQLPDILVECGYEPDRSWLEQLKDVTPAEVPSYFSETDTVFQRLERRMRYARKAKRFLKQHGG